MSNNCQHEHNEEEHCDCCCCCDEEKELVRDRRELSDEEIEKIISEKYADKDDKTKVFIRKALKKQGDWYDYSKIEYKNAKTKVTMRCPIHGDFLQSPTVHLNGSGCIECAKKAASERYNLGKDEFVKRASEKYNNKFDYSQVEYTNLNTPVKIICPIHGEFFQSPASHLNSSIFGCRECSKESLSERLSMGTEEFIRRSKEIHGDKFNYSKVDYVNNCTPVIIGCKIHGDFSQLPANHLKGCGCPDCAGNVISNTEEFIEKAKNVHGNKYDYSKVNYVNALTKVIIHCNKHNIDFEQTPGNHLYGFGCPLCGNETIGEKLSKTTEEFIEKAKNVHGDKYRYDKTIYTGSANKVTVWCPEHGYFEQVAENHLAGHGCPKCKRSIGEELIEKYLNSIKLSFISTKYTVLDQERHIYVYPDFIISELNIWIEYNGEQHYQYIDNFHNQEKEHFRSRTFYEQIERDILVRKYCKDNQIRLIEIPYILKTYEEISDFLDKVLFQNIDPNTLVDYKSLYKLDDTGFKLGDLFPS